MDLAPKRWTLDEWDLMIRSGVLGEDDRVLLLEGEIFEMCPQNSPHSTGISLAQQVLAPLVGPDAHLRVQLPLYLGGASDPEPDLAVVAGSPRDYAEQHPRRAALVLEVSDTSVAFDRGRKARLYARFGVPEYWVLDLQARQLHQYTQAHELGYEGCKSLEPQDRVYWGGGSFLVSDLLP